MPFIDITSLLIGVMLGCVLGGLCIIALIRAAEFFEGPLGAAEYATRYPVQYGAQRPHSRLHDCAAALADAERLAVAANRHDIAIQIHDTRAELGHGGAS